jgi:hypothetical protein
VKTIFTLLVICSFVGANAQKEPINTVIAASKEYHQALVKQNKDYINQRSDEALSYGHSNGWIQTKTDMVKDFETGRISYQSIKEDSITVHLNGNFASVRFVGDFTATNNGVKSDNHLKVLEVWVQGERGWILFSRQGYRLPYR